MPPEKNPNKVRASYKGQLTSYVSYIDSLKDRSLTETEVSELQARLGKFISLYDRFDEVQLTVECECDDKEQLFLEMKERNEFESLYYKLRAQSEQLLNQFQKQDDDKGSHSHSHSHSSHHSNKNKSVKLPTITLPKFAGSNDNWLEFHDTFLSLIHNNDEIDEINKFHYLRSSLEGSAAIVIKSIEFCAKNYNVAWTTLCERFDNKRLLSQSYVTALFNIKPIKKESSVGLKSLIDEINQNLRMLESIGESTYNWDTLLIHIMTQKLDANTLREWEEHRGRIDKNEKITLDIFTTFLRSWAELVETLELSRNNNNDNQSNKTSPKIKSLVSVQGTSKSCPKCSGEHNLNNCSQFLSLSSAERLKSLPSYKICFNCLVPGHFANKCKKQGCKICKRKHHTLVHVTDLKNQGLGDGSTSSDHSDSKPPPTTAQPPPTGTSGSSNDNGAGAGVTLTAHLSSQPSADQNAHGIILLSTALIKVVDHKNREHVGRAILDSGSTSCIMTKSFLNKLNLPANHIHKSVTGINNASFEIKEMCQVSIKSLNGTYFRNINCFILPSITDNVPTHQVNITGINIPSDICLADPHFHTPAAVDFIIGADVFWDILLSQRMVLGQGKPVLYETKLGWLVSGPVTANIMDSAESIKCNFTKIDSSLKSDINVDDNLQTQLTRFWQLEEVGPQLLSHFSKEEKSSEEHFVKHTSRTPDGRFCVKIPLKESVSLLGDSFPKAKRCFLSLERRLENQPKLNHLYKEFMAEYEALGHMSECQSPSGEGHFIPHHGVLRESSSTTKLRAVFNASSPTSTGISYNQIQMVGPVVQDDLLSILLRFRQHKYILAADVEKMYRQISVHPDFRYLQQIVWRPSSSDTLKTYQLNTVTYGTASAPFLATRCLMQIGLDCKDKKIGDIIIHDMYVDDLLTGADTIDEVKHIRSQVTAELASACMPLRKWKSNDSKLVHDNDQQSVDLNIGSMEPSKTLGLTWHSNSDELCFPFDASVKESNTKRDMLSVIAQIFDPLGLLSPYVIKMKMLMQRLWLCKLTWDEPLPSEVSEAWLEIIKELPMLNQLRVPRHVVCESPSVLEIHVFSDASEKAYGACLYIRSLNDRKEASVRLLISKSRVAPIKPTTIPRLELCGALVGTRLYEKVRSSLRATIQSVTFWTDSTIVLGWLKMMPSKLQPFVRNRIAEILEKTNNSIWRHVPTDQNPADLISRGVDISSLHSLDLWWSGPSFLQEDETNWPTNVKTLNRLPELRPEVSLNTVLTESRNKSDKGLINFDRFSKFLKLKRTAAYVLRFIKGCKTKTHNLNSLSEEEMQQGLNLIIKLSQIESFPEYKFLLRNQPFPKRSPLRKFNVFLDNDKIMRVGGRLENSNFDYNKKHPIVIQSTHRFTQLLFEYEHRRLAHAGPQLLLYSVRESYWPIGGQHLAKACYRKCVRCVRMRGRTLTPLMADLPLNRVKPGYPFENVGVDYAGPMNAASRQGRGCRQVKVYIVVFICFSTKAIHLELVGDLTSNNYLLALRRFISRRGKPVNIYSDNGTSFIGAYNDLSKFLKDNCNSLAEDVANEGITFHFIPAYSPHFGGLWEAGVKSTKFHLQRVLGHCNLTYEEFNSTLVQIEAILNSRPLTPMSSDPEDLMPLTPGHFLIGRPMTSLPSRDYTAHATNHLTRFQRIEQLRQHFWSRWSKEYVSQLQHRVKWQVHTDSLKINSLVILKEDTLPPLKWKMGRIVAVYPGSDKICRVADVKTSSGVVRRSFSRICPLPEAEVDVERRSFNARGHV